MQPDQPTQQPNPYDFLNDVQAAPDPSQQNNKRRKIFLIVIVSAVLLLITALIVAFTTSSSSTNNAMQEEYKPGNIEILRSAYNELQLNPEDDGYTIDGCGEAGGEEVDQGLCYYTIGYYYDDSSYFSSIQGALESTSWQYLADESEDAYLSYSKNVKDQKVCAVLSYGSLDDDDERVSLVLNTQEYTCQ